MPARMKSGTAHIAALAFDHNAGNTPLIAILSGDPSELELGDWSAGTASVMDVASWISHASGVRSGVPGDPCIRCRAFGSNFRLTPSPGSVLPRVRRPEDLCWAEGRMSVPVAISKTIWRARFLW